MVNLNSVPAGMQLADWVKTWPVINQVLYPLMIVNYVNTSGNGQNQEAFLWYPGAVPGTDSNGWPAFRIALVTGRQNGNGAETIEWVPVIEESLQDSPSTGDSFFAFNLQSQYRGLVALRINYPYQSATLSAYQQETTSPPSPNGQALAANDSQVVVSNPGDFAPAAGALTNSVYSTYGGQYGLGSQFAWLGQVRPFRRLISAQAVAPKRSLFESNTMNRADKMNTTMRYGERRRRRGIGPLAIGAVLLGTLGLVFGGLAIAGKLPWQKHAVPPPEAGMAQRVGHRATDSRLFHSHGTILVQPVVGHGGVSGFAG